MRGASSFVLCRRQNYAKGLSIRTWSECWDHYQPGTARLEPEYFRGRLQELTLSASLVIPVTSAVSERAG
jgi:hypothetical protein